MNSEYFNLDFRRDTTNELAELLSTEHDATKTGFSIKSETFRVGPAGYARSSPFSSGPTWPREIHVQTLRVIFGWRAAVFIRLTRITGNPNTSVTSVIIVSEAGGVTNKSKYIKGFHFKPR